MALFVLSIFSLSLVYADCGDVRLDQNGGPFTNIPVYDQGKFGVDDDICYAILGSELMDSHRAAARESLEQLTSPLSLALNYKSALASIPKVQRPDRSKEVDITQIASGDPSDLINLNIDKPICDQRWLENYVSEIADTKPVTTVPPSSQHFISEILKEISAYNKLIKSTSAKPVALPSSEFSSCRASALRAVTKAVLNSSNPIPKVTAFLQTFCKNHSLSKHLPQAQRFTPEMDPLVKEESQLENQLQPWNRHTAEDRQRIEARLRELPQDPIRTAMQGKIDSLLREGIPAGIGFCRSILTGQIGANQGQCLSNVHAAALVGSKKVGDHCEYLLRDSYGNHPQQYGLPTENKSVWVPEDLLFGSRGQLSAIEWIPKSE